MGDRLEAQINAIENIQEECKHDIREVKEHLARLISLFEDHIKTQTVHSRGQSPSPNQQVPRPFVQTTSYLPRRIDRPNLGNQGPQLRLPSGKHLDPLICQAPQEANLMDKRLKRKNHDGTLFPSFTLSYFQNWYGVVTSS